MSENKKDRSLSTREWEFLNDLMDKVAFLSPEEQFEFVKRSCNHDQFLLDQAMGLLNVIPLVDGFLEESVWEHASEVLDHFEQQLVRSLEETRRFKVTRFLGEGGMGVIYQARQLVPFQREVAIKIIVPQNRQVEEFTTGFRTECQALAQMAHENVARIFDADFTTDGYPYLTMEYFPGVSISAFVEQHHLDLRARLTLFLQVCAGVQHAHQKRILHRDIKPSNVLVAGPPQQPLVKVIDFGIAISLDLEDLKASNMNRPIAGTVIYMSPEQLSGTDLDIRTDVYSLGVLLYKILTGMNPVPTDLFAGVHPNQWKQTLMNYNPLLPSAMIQNHARQEQTPGSDLIMANRLRGDLDFIIMKAMARDRKDRYSDVHSLMSDIQSYLNHMPITGREQIKTYVIGKFLRRHYKLVSLTTTIFCLLCYLLILINNNKNQLKVAFSETKMARDVAEKEAADSRETLTMLQKLLEQPRPENNANDAKLSDTLSFASQQLMGNEVARPQVKAELFMTLGRSFFTLGQYQQAARQFSAAVSAYEQQPESYPESLIIAHERLATAWLECGLWEEAEGLWRQILNENCYEKTTSLALRGLGYLYRLKGENQTALELNLASLSGSMRGNDLHFYLTLRELATIYQNLDQWDYSEPLFYAVLEFFSAELGPDHPETLKAANNWANALWASGYRSEAIELFRQHYDFRYNRSGLDHPETLTSLYNLGRCLYESGAYTAAEQALETAFEARKRISSLANNETLLVSQVLGMCRYRLGQLKAGEQLVRDTLDRQEQLLGENHMDTLSTRNSLAAVYVESGRPDQAIKLLARTMNNFPKNLAPTHHLALYIRCTYGEALLAKSRYSDAEEIFSKLDHDMQEGRGNREPIFGLVRAYHGYTLFRSATDPIRGRSILSQGIAILEQQSSPYYRSALQMWDELETAH